MKTLYLLLLLVVITISVLIYQKISTDAEGFASKSAPIQETQPNFCPHNMSALTDDNGEILCYDDNTGGKKGNRPAVISKELILNKIVCTRTPHLNSTYLPCSQYMREYNKTMEKTHCNASMPRYFEKGKMSGCAKRVNADSTAPEGSDSTCKIYTSLDDNNSKKDSCINAKLLLNLKNSSWCSTTKCTPTLSSSDLGKPVTVGATYKDSQDNIQWCQSRASLERQLENMGSEGKEQLAMVRNGTYTPAPCGDIPPKPKPVAASPPSVAPPSVAPSSVAPPSVAPSSVAPPSVAPSSVNNPPLPPRRFGIFGLNTSKPFGLK